MPWCTGCDRFLSPSTVTATGECPRCGAAVDAGRARAPESGAATPVVPAPPTAAPAAGPVGAVPGADASVDDETPLPVPWHFKLLLGALALYLGWRAFQGVEWLVGRL